MSQADNLASLATNVNSSGVLQPAGGGTGATSFPSPGTNGNLLTSNGTTWTSAAPPVGMVYPGAGIPNSTGSAWGTSYSTTGSGTVVALATSPSFTTPALGTPSALVGTNITGTASGLSIGGNAATATTATNQSGGTVSATTGSFSGLLTSTVGGQAIFLNGATANRIEWNQSGFAAPSFTTRSNGTKLVLYPNVSGSTTDYALGIDSGVLWSSVPSSGDAFRWYAATNIIGTLTGGGALSITGSCSAASFSGAGTSLTGTASSLSIGGNAANLSGSVFSTGSTGYYTIRSSGLIIQWGQISLGANTNTTGSYAITFPTASLATTSGSPIGTRSGTTGWAIAGACPNNTSTFRAWNTDDDPTTVWYIAVGY